MGASSSRIRPRFVVAAIAMATLTGCEWPRVSPESNLPGLVAIRGQALLPMDYVVAADSQPAPRTFRAALVTLDGATLAVGTILDAEGNFSVHVPTSYLDPSPTLYQIDLLDPSRAPTYRALIRLTQRHREASLTINGASSTVALAAREAMRQGKDPSNWALDALVKHPQVQNIGLQYASQLARWSNGPTIASEPPAPAASTLEQVMAIAATL